MRQQISKSRDELDAEVEVERCYEAFSLSWDDSDYYVALASLGSLFTLLPHLTKERQKEWHGHLRKIELTQAVIFEVELRSKGVLDHMLRILSLENMLIYENLVLVLSGEEDLERIIFLLREVYSVELSIDLSGIKRRLMSLENNLVVRKELLSAKRAMRRNARFPRSR